jgi:hypothetical protein
MTATSPTTADYMASPNRVLSAANGIDYAYRDVGEDTPSSSPGRDAGWARRCCTGWPTGPGTRASPSSQRSCCPITGPCDACSRTWVRPGSAAPGRERSSLPSTFTPTPPLPPESDQMTTTDQPTDTGRRPVRTPHKMTYEHQSSSRADGDLAAGCGHHGSRRSRRPVRPKPRVRAWRLRSISARGPIDGRGAEADDLDGVARLAQFDCLGLSPQQQA